ncbi:hypothetical protein [Kitasatospora sp. NPDC058046]
MNTGQEHTTIANEKNKNEVLKSRGAGCYIYLAEVNGRPTADELWTLIFR